MGAFVACLVLFCVLKDFDLDQMVDVSPNIVWPGGMGAVALDAFGMCSCLVDMTSMLTSV